MATFLVILFLIAVLAFIGSLINPKKFNQYVGKSLSRKRISVYFGAIILVLLIFIGMVGANSSETAKQADITDTINQSSEEQKPAIQSDNSSQKQEELSLDTKKQICYDITAAQDKATKEADKLYPVDSSRADYNPDNVLKNGEKYNELSEKYVTKVRQQYEITPDEETKIVVECVENDWPLP